MRKKAFIILLAGLLFIIITGCSDSEPTGEMVHKKAETRILCQEYASNSVNLFQIVNKV